MMYANFEEFKQKVLEANTMEEISIALEMGDHTLMSTPIENTPFMQDEEWPLLTGIVSDRINELREIK